MKKTLILATVAALALGTGAAMADGPTPAQDYWGQKNLDALSGRAATSGAVNSNGGYRSFLLHSRPIQNDAGTVGGDGAG